MGKPETTRHLALKFADASGQKECEVPAAPDDGTIGELLQEVLSKLDLPRNSPTGAPLAYGARLERQGRYLSDSERIGDALEYGDRVTLHPNVDAGRGC